MALTGYAALIGGTLGNSGAIIVKGRGNLLAGETVTNEEGASITIASPECWRSLTPRSSMASCTIPAKSNVTAKSTIDGSAVDGGGTIVIGGVRSSHGDGGNDNGEQTLGDGVAPPVTLTLADGATISRESLTIEHDGKLDVSGVRGATLSRVEIDSHGTIKVTLFTRC